MIQTISNRIHLYSKGFSENEKPSAIKYRVLNNTEILIYVGTTITNTGDKSHVTPSRGSVTIILVSRSDSESNINVKEIDSKTFNGGILDFEVMTMPRSGREMLLVGVNSFVQFFDVSHGMNFHNENSAA